MDALRALMDNPNNIRNFSVVAHVDHGKSTLTDSLLYSNEIISKEDVGNKRATDTRKDEELRGITIKSTGVTLHYELPDNVVTPPNAKGKQYLINLIDSPGHVDFSSEVTAALRLTDGALVLVDCVEGCCVQTETVLRQALAERIKPVLCINKLDRAIMELQLEPEDMYLTFLKSIDSVNQIIATFQDGILGDVQVSPVKGTICFAAGKQGWAFGLRQFARFYSKKLGLSEDSLVEKLWGDNFYDAESKKWSKSPISAVSGKPIPRGFCKFILEPLIQVFKSCLDNQKENVEKYLKSMNLTLSQSEKEATGKDLLKNFMQKWLPAAESLLEMIVTQLPSPVQAQKYRVETLYTGPLDDQTAQSIQKCDPNGPLVMYISKMIPNKDNSRFLAFGRVFSGTVSCQRVKVMGANYVPGKKDDVAVNHPIQAVKIMMGGKSDSVDSVPCGNTCALVGVDSVLIKSGTIVSDEQSYPLVNMKYSVSPVVRVAVSCKSAGDLPKLIEALKKLSKSENLVQVIHEPTGEHVIACAGDLHLEICLNDLREFMRDAELIVSQPVVPYQETVTDKSYVNVLCKSPNGHNRVYATAEPLSSQLVEDLANGKIDLKGDAKNRVQKLAKDHGWEVVEARKIWAFGPESLATNVVVDMTKGIQYMNEVKESVVTGFQFVANRGILADEPVRGVRFNILDAMLHADTIHRGPGQIIPSAQRVFYGSMLTAKPKFLEPIYLVDIQCSDTSVSGVYSALNQKRGVVIETLPRFGTPLYTVKAYLPVTESFGFTSFLREMTSGQAFPQLIFDHWEIINEDPLDKDSNIHKIVKEIRKRKGIEPEIPPLDRYLDKL